MHGDVLEMSAKDRERSAVIGGVAAGELRQGRTEVLLGLSVRQVKRLVAAYRRCGDRGLVSSRRGRPSNHQPVGQERAKEAVG